MGYKLTGMYIGSQKVRPSGGGGWQPGANTLAYWEFNGNLDDSSGNNVTLSGTPYGYSTGVNGQALQNTGSYINNLVSSLTQGSIYSGAFAVAFCVNFQSNDSLQRVLAVFGGEHDNTVDIQCEFYNDFTGLQVYINNIGQRIAFPFTQDQGVWHSIVITGDGVNQIEAYIDGTKTNPYSNYNTTFPYPNLANYYFAIAGYNANNLIDGLVVENKHWTQTDVDSYLSTYPIS